MNELRRLVRGALNSDAHAAATPSELSTSPISWLADAATPSSNASGGCWLCGRSLAESVSTLLPAMDNNDDDHGPPRLLCHACFGLSYRALIVPPLCSRGDPGGGRHATPSCDRIRSQAEVSRTLASRVRTLEPAVYAAALRAAPACPRCRTSCLVPRNSADGRPGSVCVDGQPHVRWDCAYCGAAHTLESESCRCGRGGPGGAHREPCPGLACGGRGEATCARQPLSTTGEEVAAEEPAEREATVAGSGDGGHSCQPWCPAPPRVCGGGEAVDASTLAPYERQLREAFQSAGYTTGAMDAAHSGEGHLREEDVCGDGLPLGKEPLFPLLARCLLGDAGLSHFLRGTVAQAMEDDRERYEAYVDSLVAHRDAVWVDVGAGPVLQKRAREERRLRRREVRTLFKQYLASLRDGTHPGDELCLSVAARYLGVTVHVLTAEPVRWHVVFSGSPPPTTSDVASPSRRPPVPAPCGRCYLSRWTPTGSLRSSGVVADSPGGDGGGGDRGAHHAGSRASAEPLLEPPLQSHALPSGVPFFLMDERPPAGHSLGHEVSSSPWHLFLHRQSPAGPFYLHEPRAGPFIASREALLADLATGLAGVVSDVRSVHDAAALRSRRPAVPVRLYVTDAVLEGGASAHPSGPPPPPRRVGKRSDVDRCGAGSVAVLLPPARPPPTPQSEVVDVVGRLGVEGRTPVLPASRGPLSTFARSTESSSAGETGEDPATSAPPPLRPPRRSSQAG